MGDGCEGSCEDVFSSADKVVGSQTRPCVVFVNQEGDVELGALDCGVDEEVESVFGVLAVAVQG